jgi:hypothetical protein
MSPALVTPHKVEVDAPDGPAALALERRLFDLSPTARMYEDRWVVDVPVVRDLSGLEKEVRAWLRQIGAEETTIWIDGRVHVLPLRRVPHRSTNWDFIG